MSTLMQRVCSFYRSSRRSAAGLAALLRGFLTMSGVFWVLVAAGCSGNALAPVPPAPMFVTPIVQETRPNATPAAIANPTAAVPAPTLSATPTSVPAAARSSPPTSLPEQSSNGEILRGDAGKPLIALTFDCGSSADPTPAILEALWAYKVKATFFVTGAYADRYPQVVKQIAADGHEIANHTYSHPDLTTLSEAAILDELQRGDAALKALTGRSSKPWMRMPFGVRDGRVLAAVQRVGYTSIFWTLDSGDWQAGATAKSVADRVLNNAGNGYIVVQHCGAPQSAEALPTIIQGLRSRGLEMVTVSALLGQPPSTALPDGNDLLAWVTKQRSLAQDYVPSDLVEITGVPTTRAGLRLRREALARLTELWKDAQSQGLALFVLSSYRSYQEQADIFQSLVRQLGEAQASRVSARPGHSEHQLGTTVDFTSPAVGSDLVEAFGGTPEGRWLQGNAYRYGFVMSYPEGKEAITGYAYEPWHYRYVGVEAATSVHQRDITLHEYLAAR
ncbi:MAG TPA: D-alanyl-D-alanine carboxypeptidase family protein [Dehalococcoidia bacterium]|nr:D-alanyl-D-alanine carboxypeptidase family protein [Dehalococcoidia bacterium]